ncbi:MAG: fibronectin type III domain-containing protein [Candidatus Harrisonbacteria bacterium]|nr:fibronectin type III domain-containing protein [Candidatus Harrisonbacteria bacterium]
MKKQIYFILIATLVLFFALAQNADAAHEYQDFGSYNEQPRIVSNSVLFGQVGRAYYYRVRAFDYNQDILEYSLERAPQNMFINRYTGEIEWLPSDIQTGSNHVEVWVSDGRTHSTQFFTIRVEDGFYAPEPQPAFGPVFEQPTIQPIVYPVVVNQVSAQTQSDLEHFNVQVETDENNNVFISWQTDRPSRGQVVYGLASQADFDQNYRYEFISPQTQGLSTMHKVMLSQLQFDRSYYFRIVSTFGNEVNTSDEMSFILLPEHSGNGNQGSASAIANLVLSPVLLIIVIAGLVMILLFGRRREVVDNSLVIDKNEDVI